MQKLVTPDSDFVVPQGVQPIGRDILSAIKALDVIDPDKIECIEFRVLLKVTESANITAGGVLKPPSVLEKEIFGKSIARVVAIGDQAFTLTDGTKLAGAPKIGDLVITTKYPGITFRDENFNLYRFCNDKDVVAIVKEKAA